MSEADDYLAQEAERYRQQDEQLAIMLNAHKALTDRAFDLVAKCKAKPKLSPRSRLYRQAVEALGRLRSARRELNKLTGL